MDYDETLKEAAQRAARAARMAMASYGRGEVTDEDDLTGVLVGHLGALLRGQIGGLTWSSSVLRHRAGTAGEEARIGADLLIHVAFKTRTRRYSKGVLIQAKRVEPGTAMSAAAHGELIAQCNKMLGYTPASFVFDYTRTSMRCAPATRIAGTTSRMLYDECPWTSYRFFLELFRCPIGDPRITSGLVRDLPIPYALNITATGD
ncbi:hypothetical protein [Roseomonas mucosa]|uniref:hypothetical protein n=1 Tax=Roseomonas mucosa TaxID=207340 RepID=UPI00224663DF|nr:hypothetical protein [Roseomonas mucosa]